MKQDISRIDHCRFGFNINVQTVIDCMPYPLNPLKVDTMLVKFVLNNSFNTFVLFEQCWLAILKICLSKLWL